MREKKEHMYSTTMDMRISDDGQLGVKVPHQL